MCGAFLDEGLAAVGPAGRGSGHMAVAVDGYTVVKLIITKKTTCKLGAVWL